ncbi:MAG: NAD(P)/FAD-dependent oxidoreductase [bacterium]|nr:NAD(P)/FAD-dependent oxidoreductase [bacterium]
MQDFPIVIVGTGFSGIAMGVLLRRAGIESFTILEKADDVGGTWRDNHYPGAACDVPSHLYCFSFEPRPQWSRAFSPQAEIHAYLRHCVEKYDLRRHIRFGCAVSGAEFDAAAGTWTVRIEGQAPLVARALVLGNGALCEPAMPDIPGLATFTGPCFHSARWDHDVDLAGKRVAVIGTGASAIQFVPQLAPRVGHLDLFQRTPPWVLPKPDRRMRRFEQRLFRRLPFVNRLHRAWIYWTMEARALGFVVNPKLMTLLQRLAHRYLARAVPDPVLREKVTPRYAMGCKRILLSNDYYPALGRENVDVVTEGIAAVTPAGVRTRDGVLHPADAIVCGTGFMVGDFLTRLHVVGRGGRTLHDAMAARDGHYLGIAVHGFPNLFMLMGPNTGLGHNSMIFMIEAQARYALQAIQALRRRRLRFVDVLPARQRAFTDALQAKLRRSIWASGCQSWYLDADGYNTTTWPGFTWQYWWQTRRLALSDYECVPEGTPAHEPVATPLPAPAT